MKKRTLKQLLIAAVIAVGFTSCLDTDPEFNVAFSRLYFVQQFDTDTIYQSIPIIGTYSTSSDFELKSVSCTDPKKNPIQMKKLSSGEFVTDIISTNFQDALYGGAYDLIATAATGETVSGGITLLPAKEMKNRLGGSISYDAATQTLHAKFNKVEGATTYMIALEDKKYPYLFDYTLVKRYTESQLEEKNWEVDFVVESIYFEEIVKNCRACTLAAVIDPSNLYLSVYQRGDHCSFN